MTLRFLFPEGKTKAITLSYDDGTVDDIRLVEIFNKYNLKGTFHLNSANLNNPGKVGPEQIPEVYAGHEISCHGATHPFLERLAPGEAMREVWNDRIALEAIAKYPVTGMSYPYGTYNSQVVDILKNAGIVYCRTTQATKRFSLPNNYLEWHPTCHHRDMLELAPTFLEHRYSYSVFYVWGHAFEFDRNNNWEIMEQFAEIVANKPEIWYATNIDIYRYDTAVKNIVLSADGKLIYNPSATTVWFTANGELKSIAAGQTLQL